jgi:hypothetical protein
MVFWSLSLHVLSSHIVPAQPSVISLISSWMGKKSAGWVKGSAGWVKKKCWMGKKEVLDG